MLKGYSLHSGKLSQVWLHQVEGPVRFRRNKTDIPALVSFVSNTRRSTTLAYEREHVALVEHLLAALYVRGWWKNLVIEVSADELPIFDGSAEPWLGAIDALGEPPSPPESLLIDYPLRYQMAKSELSVSPGVCSLYVETHFDHPAIGKQVWEGEPSSFKELLAARTFGFLHELESLREAGLARQASLENAIVFDGAGPMRPLRFADEVVRHKALDVLGDLFLLGKPLQAKLEVIRGSHQSHVAFVRHLLKTLLPNSHTKSEVL